MLQLALMASILLTVGPYVAAVITLIALLGVMWQTKGFVQGNQLKGQLEAKDEIIRTNDQSIHALEHRLDVLEGDLATLTDANTELRIEVGNLRGELDVARARYEELQKYTAPEAVARFEEAFASTMKTSAEMQARASHAIDTIDHIGEILEGRTVFFHRLDEILSRLEASVEAQKNLPS